MMIPMTAPMLQRRCVAGVITSSGERLARLPRAGRSGAVHLEARADLSRELLGEARLHQIRDRADGEGRGPEVRLEVVAGQHDDWDGGGLRAILEFSDRGPAVD